MRRLKRYASLRIGPRNNGHLGPHAAHQRASSPLSATAPCTRGRAGGNLTLCTPGHFTFFFRERSIPLSAVVVLVQCCINTSWSIQQTTLKHLSPHQGIAIKLILLAPSPARDKRTFDCTLTGGSARAAGQVPHTLSPFRGRLSLW